ncbi:hypothetical protein B0H34DRAFT_681188 [Crassisporium funariophilum]|nr:hypothetical protein B0H34DRAFT_681188 [Crassisporium funariophilum]
MQSNVGNSQIHEANEQRPQKVTGPQQGSVNAPPRFEAAGKAHIDTDSKDERSIANRLSAAEKHEAEADSSRTTITDPLKPARDHGNEPSRGAKIDAQIQEEEQELLKKKGN